MKFWKKTVTLRLPLWSVLAAVLVLLILIGALLLRQTNFWENRMLRTLDPKDISSAYIYASAGTLVQQEELSAEDTAAVTAVINEVRLPGKPYVFDVMGGGPSAYVFILHDGTELRIGCQLVSNSYFYYLDGGYYYICTEGEGTVPTAFLQLEELHKQQRQVYFS